MNLEDMWLHSELFEKRSGEEILLEYFYKASHAIYAI